MSMTVQPPKPVYRVAARRDSYTDSLTTGAAGTAVVQGSLNMVGAGRLASTMLSTYAEGEFLTLYLTNNLAAKIVDAPVDDAFAPGFTYEGDPDQILEGEFDRLEIKRVLATGQRWGQLYGAAAILVITDDSDDMTLPLDENNIGSIQRFRPIDATSISRTGVFNEDPANPLYGQTETYWIQPQFAGAPQEVHISRLIPLTGPDIPDILKRSARLPWSGRPVLAGAVGELSRYESASRFTERMLERKSQLVYFMEGLGDFLEELRDPDTGISLGDIRIQERIQMIDRVRSVLNTVVVDGGSLRADGTEKGRGDKIEVRDLNMANVPQMFAVFQQNVSAKSDGCPVSILFGRSAAGMNATGDGDLEAYYATCGRVRDRAYPALKRMRNLILLQKELKGAASVEPDARVGFAPLWLPTELEQAQAKQQTAFANLQNAQAAASNVDAGLVAPDVMARWFETEGLFGITKEDLESRLKDITDEAVEKMEAMVKGGAVPDPTAQPDNVNNPDEPPAGNKPGQTQPKKPGAKANPPPG